MWRLTMLKRLEETGRKCIMHEGEGKRLTCESATISSRLRSILGRCKSRVCKGGRCEVKSDTESTSRVVVRETRREKV